MTMISRKSIGLKLCSWNANGILNKISEFKIFVEKHSPDLALIQETHLRPHHNINIPNYNCYRNDRIGDGIARGGTLILVKKNISHHNIPTPTLNHIEATVVVITPQNLNPVSIISIYVPPSSDARLFTLDLENLLQTNSNCVIFGDFNATHNMWNCPNNFIRGCQLKTFAEILDLTIAFPDSPTSLWQCQRFFRKKRSNIPSLTSSSGVANSDDQKANILASTLQNNFSENKRPGDGRHPIDQEITNTLNNFFDNHPLIPISPTEPDEILTYIKSLKNNKAPGSDLITNKMVKNFPIKIIMILTYLINKILFLRHFPNNWKNAIVFPIKKPNKNAHFPDSYRPISLLSILSKITEYVILNRLKSYTNENNFINPNQYGFTRNLSTYHPLLGLTEKITAGFQRGRSTGAVFLDIQKAFDRVWVSGLIYKLITNNFLPALIHLINSYLVNRTFQVRVNDTLSSSLSIKYGVPQGSLLGPLLFNIYINDIPTHPQTSTNIYADDTVTLATYKNHNTITIALNNHLKLLETFFDTWKIKINVDKTIAVLFTNRKTQPTPPTLYSTQLQWSQSTKYLGLTLDKKLTWKQHIIQTRDKFRRAQRAIFPLIGRNSELNLYNKLLLYTAVLRPILTYGSPVWGYAANSNIKILEVAQNSFIRNIVKANRYARNSKIYEDIKIIPFKAYIQKLAISFFNSLPNSNNENVKMLNNYIPMPDLKRPRRILLDSYNPP
ncbi:probable RNA-directed DNA polymerase from transposon BS [Trichonephila clavipes]|nr:probable RNA-directed DNA polymerase from transposon BS [Trichonephila clavipes]